MVGRRAQDEEGRGLTQVGENLGSERGVDVLLTARMARTSMAMIGRVYGHFRNQSYQDAQARLDR